MPVRDLLKLIYRSVMIFITLVLAGGAFLAYSYSTPGNGLLLVSGILGILTLMAGLSISKLDDVDDRATVYRAIFDEMRARFPISVRLAKSNPDGGETVGTTHLQWTGGDGAPVSFQFSDPDVHRVDAPMLDEARRMASENAPIDDICRMVDPEHDCHDPAHQEAFRRIVRAMVEQG